MKNEQGFTLVEVLGAIVISGIIFVFVISVLINGMNSSTTIGLKQQLQQEANVITETVRTAYLKSGLVDNSIIKLENTEGDLLMNGQVISSGYDYQISNESIDRAEEIVDFQLTVSDGNQSYEVNTTFSKLR